MYCGRQVTGIDGNYRMTCESVMEVLRDHRDSVMAVLEAFVYDPLLNWRLMDGKLSLLETRYYCARQRRPARYCLWWCVTVCLLLDSKIT